MATHIPSLRKRKQRYQFNRRKKEIGMATSTLTVLPQGHGEIIRPTRWTSSLDRCTGPTRWTDALDRRPGLMRWADALDRHAGPTQTDALD